MWLKCIKLAGFKSFVDPTTVSFPSNMAAVVGPNGCGKSNIIDAVRWVIGESSAKNLRGESMTDVIFNGSNTRKPVAQASRSLASGRYSFWCSSSCGTSRPSRPCCAMAARISGTCLEPKEGSVVSSKVWRMGWI